MLQRTFNKRDEDHYLFFTQFTSLAVSAVALLVIVGWVTDTPFLKSFSSGFATIKFNTAVGLLLTGLALLFLPTGASSTLSRQLRDIGAFSVLLIGGLTLLQYLVGWNLGIDQLLIKERDSYPTEFPGRMSIMTATIFTLLGSALVLLLRQASMLWVETLTLCALCIALVPTIGYLYGESVLYAIPYYGTIPLPTALMLLLLCTATLAVRPEHGVMGLLTNGTAGGITARRLLPGAILLPIVMERLYFWGYQKGIYDIRLGMILITLSNVVIFTLLVGWNAKLLLRVDRRRGEAEEALRQTLDILETNLQALQQSNSYLRAEANERRAVEDTLYQEHTRAQITLNSIADGVVTTDQNGKILYLNSAAEALSGWTNTQAAGQPLDQVFQILDPVTRQPVIDLLNVALTQDRTARLPPNSILVRRDGVESIVNDSCAPIHDRDGRVIGAVLVFHDVSAVRAMSQRMSYMLQHDALTDLPNRFLLNDRLSQAIALALRHQTKTSVLFLDLDRFKHVNDTLGHAIGDRLLQELALRAKATMRETDTISRHSGDEFIILLQEISDTYDAARAASHLLASVTEPYLIDGNEIHLTGSIGISICPEDGNDADTIIKHAELAMYQAKAQGRNNYQFFMRGINEGAIQRFALEGSLRRAIAREESMLYYQPKLDIANGKIIGAEALVRWQNRQNGLVPPAQFIPIAEESGLIIPIGEWVLRKACQQNRAWQDAGYPPIPIAVNVSAVQFRDKHFLETVARVLDETGLDPQYLELELTESVTMQNLDLTVSLLESLKRMGIGLSIDDFGTGYSSLSYLKRFPIDTLKIDRSFVQDVVTNADDAAITCAIISMAKSLKQKVIAEGVETKEQLAFLRAHGCDEIQGFYVSEPLNAREFERRILQHEHAIN